MSDLGTFLVVFLTFVTLINFSLPCALLIINCRRFVVCRAITTCVAVLAIIDAVLMTILYVGFLSFSVKYLHEPSMTKSFKRTLLAVFVIFPWQIMAMAMAGLGSIRLHRKMRDQQEQEQEQDAVAAHFQPLIETQTNEETQVELV